MRALILALAIVGCDEVADVASTRPALEYPVEALPADFGLGLAPAAEDLAAYEALIESSETEMVRLRRYMTPLIVKVNNIGEDRIVWTVISFHGGWSLDAETSGNWFERRWIARRVRKAWDGQSLTDWADSDDCPGLLDVLSRVTALRAPRIQIPDQNPKRAGGAKLTIVPDREFTLWTTLAPGNDFRFSGDSDSEIGQWAIGLALALQPCWTTAEPQRD